MAQKRIKMVQHDILNDRMRLLHTSEYPAFRRHREVVSRSKAPISLQPESFVGLTLKQAKMKLGIKN